MTEKRFTYMEQFNGFCDVYDDGKVLSCMRLEYVEKTVNLLNDFCKEIDVLNYEITSLQRKADKIRRDNIALCEENEQLKQLIDTRITVGDNYRKLKEYINELLTKKYNHYEEMKKTIRNKEAQRIYTNILKVIKDLQEDIDTEWGDEVRKKIGDVE